MALTLKELENVQTEVGEQAKHIHWRYAGTATVMAAADNYIMPVDGHATHYNFYSETAPVGAGIVISIQLNDVNVKAVTVAAGTNALEGDDLALVYSRGDRVGFKVTQVGSSTAGGDDLLGAIY